MVAFFNSVFSVLYSVDFYVYLFLIVPFGVVFWYELAVAFV